MSTLNEAVEEFLARKRITVAGVSRSGSEAFNLIYRKLRDAGSEVFAFNPQDEMLGEEQVKVFF